MTDFAAILGITAIFTLLITLVVWVLGSIGKVMIFPKAGIAGWKGFVPVYSDYLLYKIGWIGGMYWIVLIVSIVGGVMSYYGGGSLADVCRLIQFVINAVMYWNLSKKFGKGIGMAIGLILLPFLFLIILGADKDAEYEGVSSQ